MLNPEKRKLAFQFAFLLPYFCFSRSNFIYFSKL